MMGQSRGSFQNVCTPPANLTGQTINVTVSDMGMMSMMGTSRGMSMMLSAFPSTIVAGKVNIVVTNLGRRVHELVILPLANGQSAGQRLIGSDGKIDEAESLGEASNNCGAGTGEGVETGSRTWTTVTLSPGRYEFVCNIANHYAAGMYQEVTVSF